MSDFDRNDVPVFSNLTRANNPRWLKSSAVVVAVASAGVIGFAVMRGPKVPEVTGSVRASARETVTLGTRGVAVAEPGAAFDWKVVGTGAASVEQTEGSVFYRVERGGSFVVSTPAGDVTATGTCFTVEVRPSATVLLTVYEGRVLFENDTGKTEVAAGQTAVAGANTAPQRVAGDPSRSP